MRHRIAGSDARGNAVRVDVEPIVTGEADRRATIESGEAIARHPDPSAVLTEGMRAELAGRELRGGEPGGDVVKCTLDLFAARDDQGVTSRTFTTLYVDARCDVLRASDAQLAWRGELRARACAQGGSTFDRGSSGLQQLIDRMMSDAAREMASDLAVRVLGLSGTSSARAFEDEAERSERAGLDDSPLGAAALAGILPPSPALEHALGDKDNGVRASAWNAVAMSVGPGDRWPLGDTFVADEDVRVRFYQYKALAREASAATLVQLQTGGREGRLVAPLRAFAQRLPLASGGLGISRSRLAKYRAR